MTPQRRLMNLGRLLHRYQESNRDLDFDGAMALYEEAERVYRERGDRDDVAESLQQRAKILREQRDLDGALELLALVRFALRAEVGQLNFTPIQSSGIYALGERAGWTVTPAPGAAPAGQYAYEIKKNNRDTIQSGTLSFASGSATIEATLDEPAMLYVTVKAEGAPPSSAVQLGAAIAPTQLRPCLPRPADFDSFWDAKLLELSSIPLNPVTTSSRRRITESPGGRLGLARARLHRQAG